MFPHPGAKNLAKKRLASSLLLPWAPEDSFPPWPPEDYSGSGRPATAWVLQAAGYQISLPGPATYNTH